MKYTDRQRQKIYDALKVLNRGDSLERMMHVILTRYRVLKERKFQGPFQSKRLTIYAKVKRGRVRKCYKYNDKKSRAFSKGEVRDISREA